MQLYVTHVCCNCLSFLCKTQCLLFMYESSIAFSSLPHEHDTPRHVLPHELNQHLYIQCSMNNVTSIPQCLPSILLFFHLFLSRCKLRYRILTTLLGTQKRRQSRRNRFDTLPFLRRCIDTIQRNLGTLCHTKRGDT